MAENKYQALDEAICEHIAQGRGHATNSSALEAIARPLLASNKTPFPVVWRLIDRRMQTMRKAGRLVYERTEGGGHGRWRVVDAQRKG
jgi:hypothetical protein